MNSDPSPTTIISSTQRGGQLIEVNWDVEANYQHQDWPGSPATGLRRWGGWLGTERLRTSYNGGVEASFTSLPWGDGQSAAGMDTDANHYAMLDHDTESDTDHAQFRQYSNLQGRFLSPDPYDGSYDLSNPQSLNRYVYAQNSPLGFVDPSGENEIGVGTGGLMMGCYSDGLAVPCSYLFGGGAPGGIDGGGFGGGFGGSMVPVTTETTFSTTITINNSIYLPGFSDLVSILGDPGDYFGPPQTIQIDSNLLNLPDTQITLNNTFSSSSYYYFPVNVNPNGSSISTSGGGGGVAPSNATIGPADPHSKLNVPPDPAFCGGYRDGTGAGDALYHLCMNFPNNPWSNCVRGNLLNQYTRNGNPIDLSVYLFWDHPKDFATCAVH